MATYHVTLNRPVADPKDYFVTEVTMVDVIDDEPLFRDIRILNGSEWWKDQGRRMLHLPTVGVYPDLQELYRVARKPTPEYVIENGHLVYKNDYIIDGWLVGNAWVAGLIRADRHKWNGRFDDQLIAFIYCDYVKKAP